jgi:hypothetical protein
MQPLLGIELDDSSHKRQERQERDEFVNQLFAAANLSLARIPAQLRYNTKQLEEMLNLESLGIEPTVQSGSQAAVKDTLIPTCPKCGSDMVLRTTTKGPNKGKQFWGCPNFPKCRGILKYQSDESKAETM